MPLGTPHLTFRGPQERRLRLRCSFVRWSFVRGAIRESSWGTTPLKVRYHYLGEFVQRTHFATRSLFCPRFLLYRRSHHSKASLRGSHRALHELFSTSWQCRGAARGLGRWNGWKKRRENARRIDLLHFKELRLFEWQKLTCRIIILDLITFLRIVRLIWLKLRELGVWPP